MSNYSPKDEINLAFVALCKSGDTYHILESLYEQSKVNTLKEVINFILNEYARDFAHDYREDLVMSLREKFEKS